MRKSSVTLIIYSLFMVYSLQSMYSSAYRTARPRLATMNSSGVVNSPVARRPMGSDNSAAPSSTPKNWWSSWYSPSYVKPAESLSQEQPVNSLNGLKNSSWSEWLPEAINWYGRPAIEQSIVEPQQVEKVKAVRNKRPMMNKELQALRQKKNMLAEKVGSLKEELKTFIANNRNFENDVDFLNDKNYKESQIVVAELELENIKKQLGEKIFSAREVQMLRLQKQKLVHDISSLRDALRATNMRRMSFNSNAEFLRAKGDLENQIFAKEAELGDFKKHIGKKISLTQEVRMLRLQKQKVKRDINALKEALKNATMRRHNFKNDSERARTIADARNNIVIKEIELTNIKEQLERKDASADGTRE